MLNDVSTTTGSDTCTLPFPCPFSRFLLPFFGVVSSPEVFLGDSGDAGGVLFKGNRVTTPRLFPQQLLDDDDGDVFPLFLSLPLFPLFPLFRPVIHHTVSSAATTAPPTNAPMPTPTPTETNFVLSAGLPSITAEELEGDTVTEGVLDALCDHTTRRECTNVW